MQKERVPTDLAFAAVGAYSQADVLRNLVFVSGQLPLKLDGKMSGHIAEQSERVMENLKAVLQAASTSLDRVVKTTCYLADQHYLLKPLKKVYTRYFCEPCPARSYAIVKDLPHKKAMVMVDAIVFG